MSASLSAVRTARAVDHLQLGNAYAARGALEDAAAAFTAALTAQPGSRAALHGLGVVRLRQDRFAAALRCFTALAAAAPSMPGLAYHTGVAHQGLGDEAAAAAAFRRALVRDPGCLPALNNLCVALLRTGEPAEALAVCARFLALAPASPKVHAYQAAALLALGDRAAALRLLDFERLVVQLDVAPLVPHNAALAAAILAHPSLCFEPAGKSTRGGRQTGELLTAAAGPALGALATALHATVHAYFAHVRARLPDHPYVAHLPRRWRLVTWAVVLDAHGHQMPHFHPAGCLSGVYYVRVPDSLGPDHAGWLELGDTRAALGAPDDPPLSLVAPQPGRLVVFPSYVYHRTIPFTVDAPRISVAFDVIPVG
ncbi:MAG TPA: putative 2OG-Fe(II) oxygenase [Kofleriaceae bacterium]|nr:putative 2OG-Fe(II) oxygenase [Kofleriaceae bacterium]